MKAVPVRIADDKYPTSVLHFPKEHRKGCFYHPTQKPVILYKWLIQNYAKPGFKVLDTHVGSASSLIAFSDEGINYVGFEKNETYYRTSVERLMKYKSQITLFDCGMDRILYEDA